MDCLNMETYTRIVILTYLMLIVVDAECCQFAEKGSWWCDELVNWHYQVGRRSRRTWYPCSFTLFRFLLTYVILGGGQDLR